MRYEALVEVEHYLAHPETLMERRVGELPEEALPYLDRQAAAAAGGGDQRDQRAVTTGVLESRRVSTRMTAEWPESYTRAGMPALIGRPAAS